MFLVGVKSEPLECFGLYAIFTSWTALESHFLGNGRRRVSSEGIRALAGFGKCQYRRKIRACKRGRYTLIADHMNGIERFEADLWKVADNLRANSHLASNEYFMPILGLIFLRHATSRYYAALAAIEEAKGSGRDAGSPPGRSRLHPAARPHASRGSALRKLLEKPKDGNLGAVVTAAVEAVEGHFPPLAGQLPKDYQRFEDGVLEDMMRTFDSEVLRNASGDVFGRIYEYFLAEFSRQGAHDDGGFFTPPSIVQTIVNVIEPDHGIVLDPGRPVLAACSCSLAISLRTKARTPWNRSRSTAMRRTRLPRSLPKSTSLSTDWRGGSGPGMRRSLITRIHMSWLDCATSSWPIHPSMWTRLTPNRSRATSAYPSDCQA